MPTNTKARAAVKEAFAKALNDFVKDLGGCVSSEDGQWTVRRFIDIFKNIYEEHWCYHDDQEGQGRANQVD